jgi:hypothetical protein
MEHSKSKEEVGKYETISDHRWSRFEINGNFLSNGGNVRATVWKRNMGAD